MADSTPSTPSPRQKRSSRRSSNATAAAAAAVPSVPSPSPTASPGPAVSSSPRGGSSSPGRRGQSRTGSVDQGDGDGGPAAEPVAVLTGESVTAAVANATPANAAPATMTSDSSADATAASVATATATATATASATPALAPAVDVPVKATASISSVASSPSQMGRGRGGGRTIRGRSKSTTRGGGGRRGGCGGGSGDARGGRGDSVRRGRGAGGRGRVGGSLPMNGSGKEPRAASGAAAAAAAAAAGTKRKRGGLVTVSEVLEDELMMVAAKNWRNDSIAVAKGIFKPRLVSEIYRQELRSCSPYPGKSVGPESSSRLQLLELSMYLENYLWPNFCPKRSTAEHMMSAILLINAKFHEGVSVWEALGISEGRMGVLPPTPTSTNPASLEGNPFQAHSTEMVVASPGSKPKRKSKGVTPSEKNKTDQEEGDGDRGDEEEAGGGLIVVGASKEKQKTGEERFAEFFECVLGLAMGEWPRKQLLSKAKEGVAAGTTGDSVLGGNKDAAAAAVMDMDQEEDGDDMVDEEDDDDQLGDGAVGAGAGDAADEGDKEGKKHTQDKGKDEGDTEGGEEKGVGVAKIPEGGVGSEEHGPEGQPPAKKVRQGKKQVGAIGKKKQGWRGSGKKEGSGGSKGAKGGGGGGNKRGPRVPGWEGLSMHERIVYITFMVNVFQSLEESVVRSNVLRLASLPLWGALQPGRLALELRAFPQLKRHWQHLKAKAKGKSSESGLSGMQLYESEFLPNLVRMFLASVEGYSDDTSGSSKEADGGGGGEAGEGGAKKNPAKSLMDFCERFMEFLIDLLCQLPTRRFLCVVLEDMRVLERCGLSALAAHPKARLFRQLLEMFRFYLGFEINDQTGKPLTDKDMMDRHHSRLHVLQKIVFEHYREALPEFPFVSSAAAGKREFLKSTLERLPVGVLKDLAQRMILVAKDQDIADGDNGASVAGFMDNKAFLMEVVLNHFADRDSQIQQVNELPLYPNETLLWDENLVPLGQYYGGKVMALPKLNLQFLTPHDYLLRSFNLFRLESAYEIRGDLVDAIRRTNPRRDPAAGGATRFEGWARMATPISGVSITEVKKPNLGEKVPAEVLAEVSLNLAHFDRMHMREEWDSLREHDVVFLVSIQSPNDIEDSGILNLQQQLEQQHQQYQPGSGNGNGNWHSPSNGNGAFRGGRGGRGQGGRGKGDESRVKDEEDPLFPARFGVVAVRGAEVYELADEEGHLLNDPATQKERKNAPPVGNKRTLRLRLDPAQYHSDMKSADMVYETVNLLVRRNAKENNFKGILETIRDLMNTSAVGNAMPPWLHDVFLGYGDPAGAHYRSLPEQVTQDVDFGDTLLDTEHVREAFPGASFKFCDESGKSLTPQEVAPPFRLSFQKSPTPDGPLVALAGAAGKMTAEKGKEIVTVTPYALPNPGPYPQDVPKKNTVRFTPVQVEAIRSGINPGLTMVVGPPGTGKTDVAVQVINNLYHSFPNQRTIMVAHSNAALNDLFEKIMDKDIDERHLLRLGAGERELREGTMKDFSKFGRVNYTLQRRLELLAEVERLAESIHVDGDVGYTGETAEYFQLFHVTSRLEKFEAELQQIKSKGKSDAGSVKDFFPFTEFFKNAPAGEALFSGKDLEKDLEVARGCFRHINKMFEELADYRAFELLRSHSARSDYLLTKQARIIAMTCTHAALIRRKLVELGFKYDNMVMEESAQILEVETFIPMMLQDVDPVLGCRLKRVVLIGDHHQLPPVVKSMAFQKYSKLDQSLFTRFVRLGTPTVELNAQGRARPEIAALYNWRYKELGNLSSVQTRPAYLTANAGLAYNFQLVDVPDFEGRGETTPTAYFYQNLGEAEYVVAVYQYMRLLGYPAEKISILTTYNGQCQLIQDVVNQRCANNDIFGEPGRIATVDKYQGQQNDYVLLSLVRTRAVGHLRDVRRLVVALSRARLGLYVFCRQSLFQNCYELSPAFNLLLRRPSRLRLVLNEAYPGGQRPGTGDAGPALGLPLYEMRSVTDMGVLVHQMASAIMTHRAALAQVSAHQAQQQQRQREALQAAATAAADKMRSEEEKREAIDQQTKKTMEASATGGAASGGRGPGWEDEEEGQEEDGEGDDAEDQQGGEQEEEEGDGGKDEDDDDDEEEEEEEEDAMAEG